MRKVVQCSNVSSLLTNADHWPNSILKMRCFAAILSWRDMALDGANISTFAIHCLTSLQTCERLSIHIWHRLPIIGMELWALTCAIQSNTQILLLAAMK